MKPFFIFCFFPFFRQIAKRKVLVFCSQCFAHYTTTRKNRELRRADLVYTVRHYYTTTRKNRELRLEQEERKAQANYTTTRKNRELRPQCYRVRVSLIIPLREKTGNYDKTKSQLLSLSHYTTTRKNRELRQPADEGARRTDYTTTRKNRELRRWFVSIRSYRIIPLREKTGNYDSTELLTQ